MYYLLRCRVYPGQFSDEYAVSAEEANGNRFSLFVPSNHVRPVAPPSRETTVDGLMRVDLCDESNETALVKLPRESFESGRFVTVRRDQLELAPQPLEPQP